MSSWSFFCRFDITFFLSLLFAASVAGVPQTVTATTNSACASALSIYTTSLCTTVDGQAICATDELTTTITDCAAVPETDGIVSIFATASGTDPVPSVVAVLPASYETITSCTPAATPSTTCDTYFLEHASFKMTTECGDFTSGAQVLSYCTTYHLEVQGEPHIEYCTTFTPTGGSICATVTQAPGGVTTTGTINTVTTRTSSGLIVTGRLTASIGSTSAESRTSIVPISSSVPTSISYSTSKTLATSCTAPPPSTVTNCSTYHLETSGYPITSVCAISVITPSMTCLQAGSGKGWKDWTSTMTTTTGKGWKWDKWWSTTTTTSRSSGWRNWSTTTKPGTWDTWSTTRTTTTGGWRNWSGGSKPAMNGNKWGDWSGQPSSPTSLTSTTSLSSSSMWNTMRNPMYSTLASSIAITCSGGSGNSCNGITSTTAPIFTLNTVKAFASSANTIGNGGNTLSALGNTDPLLTPAGATTNWNTSLPTTSTSYIPTRPSTSMNTPDSATTSGTRAIQTYTGAAKPRGCVGFIYSTIAFIVVLIMVVIVL